MTAMQVQFEGKLLPQEEADEVVSHASALAIGPNFYKTHTAYAFLTVADFDSWAQASGLTGRVSRLRERIAAAQDACATTDDIVQAARNKERRMRTQLQRLSNETGYPIGSEALLRCATIERPADVPKIFDSAILWENINYGGRWLPVYQDLPDLTWFNFNDITTSIRGIGEGALFSDTRYRGRIFWLLTNPLPPGFAIFSIPWLAGFNDVTSSLVVYS